LKDGLANTGIGALDTKDEAKLQSARNFYEQLGAFAKLKGITISLIRYHKTYPHSHSHTLSLSHFLFHFQAWSLSVSGILL
jgi:hypothetical protein